MARFPTPANRPRFKTLLPVDTVKPSNNMYFFLHNVPTQRQYRHFPDRTLWSGPDGVHAIVYHPTHEYWPAVQKWVTPPSISFLSPELFDLFLTSQNAVYYVGVYAFHSMRDVHPPGSPIPPDVSPVAIHQATGVPAANVNPWDKITECFLDGHIKVECFGLQCVGFDHELYHKLRLRFVQPAGGEVPLKRRADDVDLRKGGYARARPV
ncbi:hypothetical protein B0H17DRAFT_71478 [Mycena rosella]|uniref:DUF6697 domain-containing protein n=1 Tax=Mycena rosella TaxID=1033263 RepID=A0AAD7AYI7_MYCRO|nr:hypothetical protein B0H17DRAFT_71478 [Mycena rosella]